MPTCQVTRESLASTWYFFSLLLECSSTYLATHAINELFYIAMWYWWIRWSPEPFVSTGVYFIKCILALKCNSPFFHLLLSLCPDSLSLSLFLLVYLTLSNCVFLCLMSLSCRSKRSSVPTTECIFELPHFTVQATRAQTLLLQAICQSWTHSMASGAPLTLSESLLSEVYKAPGKQHILQRNPLYTIVHTKVRMYWFFCWATERS